MVVIVVVVIMTIRSSAVVPTAAIERPAMRALMPGRCAIGIARTLTLPVAAHPYVAMTVPIPEARCPCIADARRRYHFIARRRRCADADRNTYLSLSGCHSNTAKRGGNERDGKSQFFHIRPLESDVFECAFIVRGDVANNEANSRKKVLELFRSVGRKAAWAAGFTCFCEAGRQSGLPAGQPTTNSAGRLLPGVLMPEFLCAATVTVSGSARVDHVNVRACVHVAE